MSTEIYSTPNKQGGGGQKLTNVTFPSLGTHAGEGHWTEIPERNDEVRWWNNNTLEQIYSSTHTQVLQAIHCGRVLILLHRNGYIFICCVCLCVCTMQIEPFYTHTHISVFIFKRRHCVSCGKSGQTPGRGNGKTHTHAHTILHVEQLYHFHYRTHTHTQLHKLAVLAHHRIKCANFVRSIFGMATVLNYHHHRQRRQLVLMNQLQPFSESEVWFLWHFQRAEA